MKIINVMEVTIAKAVTLKKDYNDGFYGNFDDNNNDD
jgi:hypothetical protein